MTTHSKFHFEGRRTFLKQALQAGTGVAIVGSTGIPVLECAARKSLAQKRS